MFEASAAIGGGHLSRCLSLATAMTPQLTCSLAINETAVNLLPKNHPPIDCTWPDGQPEHALDELATNHCGKTYDLAVIDHYGIENSCETKWRKVASKIVVIDDLANRKHDADVLIDTLPNGAAARYQGKLTNDARLLLGAQYALLRPEFHTSRDVKRMPPNGTQPVRLLVTMGASDPVNATERVLEALTSLKVPSDITVVLGPAAPHVAEIRDIAAQRSNNVRLHVNATNMARLYLDHDLAIGAPATSALERACVGLPSVMYVTADNQRELAKALHDSDAAKSLGDAAGLCNTTLVNEIERLVSDQGSWTTMSNAGKQLVDGLGAQRTAANLNPGFVSNDGIALTGRPLQSVDAQAIYNWQTAPGAREYSRNSQPPTWDEHKTWIEARLADTASITEVIVSDDTPVAMARLDDRNGAMEVSIIVAPISHKQGIGSAAIRYLDGFMPDRPKLACVHSDNTGSLRLFEKCGYGDNPNRQLKRFGP